MITYFLQMTNTIEHPHLTPDTEKDTASKIHAFCCKVEERLLHALTFKEHEKSENGLHFRHLARLVSLGNYKPLQYKHIIERIVRYPQLAEYEVFIAAIIQLKKGIEFLSLIIQKDLTENFLNIIASGYTNYLVEIIKHQQTSKLIEKMEEGETETLLQLFKSPKFASSKASHKNQEKFWEILLTKLNMPKLSLRRKLL